MMKKVICIVAVILCFGVCFTACKTTSSASLTFNIETGDSIKVTLDTSDGLKLSQKDGHFMVEDENSTVLIGIFLTEDMYDSYEAAVLSTAEIIEQDDGFYFYQTTNEEGNIETDFLYDIPGSDTAVIIGSLEEQDVAKAAFDRLTFESV